MPFYFILARSSGVGRLILGYYLLKSEHTPPATMDERILIPIGSGIPTSDSVRCLYLIDKRPGCRKGRKWIFVGITFGVDITVTHVFVGDFSCIAHTIGDG